MGFNSFDDPFGIKKFEREVGNQVNEQNQNAWAGALTSALKPFNPDDYKGFDSSSLAQAYSQAIKRSAANRRAVASASAQKTGALSGGDTVRGIYDISGMEGEQENMMRAGLARKDYEDRYNQWRDQRNDNLEALKLSYAMSEAQRREKPKENEWLGDLFDLGGTVAGAYAGSPVGSKKLSKIFG